MSSDPLRVACVGALGRMGERVRAAIRADEAATLCAGLEAVGHPAVGTLLEDDLSIGDDPAIALADADVAIDFSIPDASVAALRNAATHGVAYVCGTTGFRDEDREALNAAAKAIPVVWAANFSVSVNVLFHLTRRAALLLGAEYDAEIVELHHSAKRDAPSGTALFLAGEIAAARSEALADHLVLERAGETGARPEGSIGIQTLRGGDNPGEHTVHFIGSGERLELAHRSATRDHFAAGALRAAKWAVGQPPGLYGMSDVLGLSV